MRKQKIQYFNGKLFIFNIEGQNDLQQKKILTKSSDYLFTNCKMLICNVNNNI